MNLSVKYWKHHKGHAAALLGAIIVSTMAMTVGMLLARSASQEQVESVLRGVGNYDIFIPLAEEDDLRALSERPEIAECELLYSGGFAKTEYSESIRFGAFDSARGEEIFYFEPEPGGRYPRGAGEVCGYRSSFTSIGVAPVVGTKLELELTDPEGNVVGTREFTISGILDNTRSNWYEKPFRSMEVNLVGTKYNTDDIDFPELFVSPEDLPAQTAVTALLKCDPSLKPIEVAQKLEEELDIEACAGDNLPMLGNLVSWFWQTNGSSEEDLNSHVSLGYRDFYSSTLIPIFLAVVLVVSFVSVYGVMSGAMLDRQRQFGLFRSMGMSKRCVRGILLREALSFAVLGVAAGYASGLLVYTAYLQLMNTFGSARIYSAFGAHVVARAMSLNPYLYPWVLGLCFSALAAALPAVRALRLSPNEMLFPEKTEKIRRRQDGGLRRNRVQCKEKQSERKKRGGRREQDECKTRYENRRHARSAGIAQKVTGRNLNRDRGVVFLIVLTGWTFVFGAAFMLAKSDSDNSRALEQLEEAGGADADYTATKDLYEAMCGNVCFNRHGEGISQENMDALRSSPDVSSASGVMQMPGVKLFYQDKTIPQKLRDALGDLLITQNLIPTEDYLGELHEKDRAAQGYDEDDLLYQLPCVAADDEMLALLAPYVVSGELDEAGLADGSKAVIVEYPDAQMENPYEVGDRLPLTDSVISDPYVETFDFSNNEVPSGYEPTFYFDYSDGTQTHIGGYTFWKKVEFETEICAILSIDDPKLQELLYAESFVHKNGTGPFVSPGYNLLCGMGAAEAWGLPDRCYTDVRVKLKKDADLERFEALWYTIIGKSGDVESVSRSDIRRRIQRKDLSNLIVFASMIVLVLLVGCFGMANSYQFAVNRNLHNLQILRAVGMSRKRLTASYIRGMFRWPLLAALTSTIPLAIFEGVRRCANWYAFGQEQVHNQYLYEEATGRWVAECWQLRFPFYIELWKQPIAVIIIAAFVCLVAINIAAGLVPLRKMRNMSIVDGMRRDDF